MVSFFIFVPRRLFVTDGLQINEGDEKLLISSSINPLTTFPPVISAIWAVPVEFDNKVSESVVSKIPFDIFTMDLIEYPPEPT